MSGRATIYDAIQSHNERPAAVWSAMAVGFGRYLQSLVRGADSAIVATSALAVLLTALVAAAATWSATRHIARLDIGDVMRAECAD